MNISLTIPLFIKTLKPSDKVELSKILGCSTDYLNHYGREYRSPGHDRRKLIVNYAKSKGVLIVLPSEKEVA